MSTTTLYFYRLPKEQAQRLSASRDHAHVDLMRGFPSGLGSTPRAAQGILWRLDADRRLLTVQSARLQPSYPSWHSSGQRALDFPEEGSTVSFRLAIACQKTPPSPVPEKLRQAVKEGRAAAQAQRQAVLQARGAPAPAKPPRGSYRSKKIVVPKAERHVWSRRRMHNIGLAVDESLFNISELAWARLGRKKGSIPFVEVDFTATVQDQQRLIQAMNTGVSAGKSYGLGLLLPVDLVPGEL